MHLSEELAITKSPVYADTKFGRVRGRRALNGAAVFLEVPYALPPARFSDPEPLPSDYQYPSDVEFIQESRYCAQPTNDGQARGVPPQDKLGLGNPSENPLFLNIVCPPNYPSDQLLPVKVYIHGGFLQFGSPHGLGSQAQYVSAARGEVYVNVGYRLSIFGFLASDKPSLSGNYGFKDQWLALLWIRENISAFGGDPNNVILTGLSAGAHSCHQLLHHATRLPPGKMAPFQGVVLQSNAIMNDPKTPEQLRIQYETVVRALGLNPASEEDGNSIKDPESIPWSSLTRAVEELNPFGTFRACTDGDFLLPGSMDYQASPQFASALRSKGVKFLVVGEMKEEWYLYAIAHPISDYASIGDNLRRYYPDGIVARILKYYGAPKDSSANGLERMFGQIASEGQVYLPVRLLHRDLAKYGFPVFRYRIDWAPEQVRPFGYVTHGTDRVLWAFRTDILRGSQVNTAHRWLDAIDEAIQNVVSEDGKQNQVRRILRLREDQSIGWDEDELWDGMMDLAANILPGEPRENGDI